MYFRWVNFAVRQAGKPVIFVNMDETSLAWRPIAPLGAVATSGQESGERSTLADRRLRFTLMATLCSDTAVQPRLPQILLTNGRALGKAIAPEGLRGNLVVWRQKSAWSSHETIKKYLSLLGDCFKDKVATHEIILLLDCAPSHLHSTIALRAQKNSIRLIYVPAGLTKFLQPADVALFGRLKERFASMYCQKKSSCLSGQLKPIEYLELLGSCLQSILPAVKWIRTFQKVGVVGFQNDMGAALLSELGLPNPLELPGGLPTEEEISGTFPRRRNVAAILALVLWNADRPVRTHNGRVVRTLD